jgi:phage repressor protein C with HTH and peptisase S24 domain
VLQATQSVIESTFVGNVLRMKATGDRIKHVRKTEQLSQLDFARRVKVSRGAVANWERNLGIKTENLQAIAGEFNVSMEWLATGRGAPPEPKGSSVESENKTDAFALPFSGGRRLLPVYGKAVAGQEGRFVLNGTRVGEVISPPSLENVPDAYAVYVHGDSMEPRYFAGEVVWVHPHRPVRRGDFAVVQLSSGEGEPPEGLVKRFVSMDEERLVLEQFNPPPGGSTILTIPRLRVLSIHKVVGSIEG